MTELALSGLALPLLGDYAPPRPRPAETATDSTRREREIQREHDADVPRVVAGELLRASEDTYSHLNNPASRFSQSGAQTNADNSNPSSRRLSLDAAVQTYRDNQITAQNQSRVVQVSGIIDEYV